MTRTHVLASLAIFACTGSDAGPPPPQQPARDPVASSTATAAPPATVRAAAPASTATSPGSEPPKEADASPEAGASAPVTSGPAQTKEATPPVFHVIAKTEADFRLHRLVDGGIVVSTGPFVMRVDDQGELIVDFSLLRGIAPVRRAPMSDASSYKGVEDWSPIAVGGRWPDAVFMSLEAVRGSRGQGGQSVTYRLTPKGWVAVNTRGSKYEHHFTAFSPWSNGAILARRGYEHWYPGQDQWEEGEGPTAAQETAATVAIAKAKKLVVVRGAAKAPEIGTSLSAFASLPSGEIVAATGGSKPRAVLVAADGVKQTIELPGTHPHIEGVAIEGPRHAWIYGGSYRRDPSDESDRDPYLVRIAEGRAETADAPPCKNAPLRTLSLLPDGAKWATCADPHDAGGAYHEHELWTQPAQGPWRRVELPDGVNTPAEVIARGSEDIWVTASAKRGEVLLHTRSRASVPELPDIGGLGRKIHEWEGLLPLDNICFPGFVPLTVPVGEADAVREKLAASLTAFSKQAAVQLVRTKIRETEQLGLQLSGVRDWVADPTKAVHKLAIASLGAEAVAPPRCWEADVAEGDIIATWRES